MTEKTKQDDGSLDLDGREMWRDYEYKFGGRVGKTCLMMNWMWGLEKEREKDLKIE